MAKETTDENLANLVNSIQEGFVLNIPDIHTKMTAHK